VAFASLLLLLDAEVVFHHVIEPHLDQIAAALAGHQGQQQERFKPRLAAGAGQLAHLLPDLEREALALDAVGGQLDVCGWVRGCPVVGDGLVVGVTQFGQHALCGGRADGKEFGAQLGDDLVSAKGVDLAAAPKPADVVEIGLAVADRLDLVALAQDLLLMHVQPRRQCACRRGWGRHGGGGWCRAGREVAAADRGGHHLEHLREFSGGHLC
jgi:hypothetical protein